MNYPDSIFDFQSPVNRNQKTMIMINHNKDKSHNL
jgi:hypothetical protein